MTYAIKRTYGKTGFDYLHAWDAKWGTSCMGSIKKAMTFATVAEADAAAIRAAAECKGTDGKPVTDMTFSVISLEGSTAETFVIHQPPALNIDAQLYPQGKVSANGKLERRIAWNLFQHLAAKGWKLDLVDDSEEVTMVADAKAAMELIFNLDEVRIDFVDAELHRHRVLLVLGNGIDMIADWGFTEGDADGFHAAMEAFDAEDYA